ncbi:elongator complex protein 5 isoform X2 [Phoenix dactylifera]|uniref:Elongator complex protein 5 n=1 Tax=Phoenix dactylifera TaxID=42345 RepID=A0A8B7BYM0_PHODC|nr:elongator complex protein 5 isoform X2 [Phoenix dactylifera]
MAETICRSLRDGSLEGEQAPALTIKDSLQSPLGSHVFDHFLSTLVSHISAGRSQASGLVLVAFNRSPSFYLDLFKRKGLDASPVDKSFRILDCFSDPLGWKDRLVDSASAEKSILKDSATVFKNVRDVNKLSSSILDLGNGFIGEGKVRFAVAIDLVSNMLRHVSLPSVAGLLNNLRSNDRISCIFWLIHSDLHEPRASAALEYISTMVASLEPMMQSSDGQKTSGSLLWLEENSRKAKFHVRLKRRNGRVKLLYEELHMEQAEIRFEAASSVKTIVDQNLLPRVQFNLQLSDKERADRSNVVLPFEHQGFSPRAAILLKICQRLDLFAFCPLRTLDYCGP